MHHSGIAVALTLAQAILLLPTARAQSAFTPDERAKILAFWAAPNRYVVSLPDRDRGAPWQVRLTPEASVWLHRYQQAIGAGKAPPTADPTAQSSGAAAGWKAWVAGKVAFDRWSAQQTAARLNAAEAAPAAGDRAAGPLPSRGARRGPRADPQADVLPLPAPPAPGPIPADLVAAVGNPPQFAAPAAPLQHTITFDEGDSYVYEDHTNVRPTYAYYRFPQGVGTGGVPLTDADRTALFDAAGLTETQKRVMMAVSKFEGSFDAVNTYDTGFVSVGFIQFVTMDDGRHSLADVLGHEKADALADFERDFHRFGIDLTPDRVLTVVDPLTGAELTGPDAVQKVIDDKRLIAVFQRAGRSSTQFRIAQIRVARENYWPGDDPIAVNIGGQPLTGKLSDVITSEAGLATFFDRKVNRGSVAPFADVLAKTMAAHSLTSLADAQKYEKEIVAACRYRGDFLADKTLKQPIDPPGQNPEPAGNQGK